jgi:hypothetical protein
MDAISSIGSTISGMGGGSNPLWQNLLKLGSAGAGGIGNILASVKRNQVLNQSLNNQQNLINLANNPSALAGNINKLVRPLSAGLTSSVGNAVQGYLGERGLSEAPGIASETLAQGLAPYQQQEQQMAINAYLTSLGLPAQATPRFLPYPQGTDLSKLFQSIFTKPTPMPFGTNGAGLMTGPNPSPTYGDTSNSGSGANFDWLNMINNPDLSGANA